MEGGEKFRSEYECSDARRGDYAVGRTGRFSLADAARSGEPTNRFVEPMRRFPSSYRMKRNEAVMAVAVGSFQSGWRLDSLMTLTGRGIWCGNMLTTGRGIVAPSA